MYMSIKKLLMLGAIATIVGCSSSNDDPAPIDDDPVPVVENTVGVVTVTGSPIVGETLTAAVTDDNGTANATFVYQWAADSVDITGATSATFEITEDELGAALTITVTYTDDDGFDESITSDPTDAVTAPAVVNVPGVVTVTGSPIVGETLTAAVADDNGTANATFVYQWAADGVDIADATSATFEITDAQLGAALTITVTYTDDDGFDESITSDPTDAVTAPAVAVNVVGTVTAEGSPNVGSTLTATVVDDNGTTTSAFVYQWLLDGVDIVGETNQTYIPVAGDVDGLVSVNVTYTDDDGFAEDITSPAVTIVAAAANQLGSVSINGDLLDGQVLTAEVTDGNGFAEADVDYQWFADGEAIAGETNQMLTLTAAQLGTTISVDADYTDNDGFDEDLSAAADDVVFSFIVDSETTLAAALAAATDGAWIGLDDAVGSTGADDYADMAELLINVDNMVITLTANSTAVITGQNCIMFDSGSTGILMDGLVFDDVTIRDGDGCIGADAVVVLNGTMNTIRNTSFLSEADRPAFIAGTSEEAHFLAVNGSDNLVERNLFSGMPQLENFEGSAISMFINNDNGDFVAGSATGNIVQYNLFRDFAFDETEESGNLLDSNSFVVQVGRSTGSDATGLGAHIVRYNRFDNVLMDRRLIQVQGGGNTIMGNTVVNSWGNIALENGISNTVTQNIMISNPSSFGNGGSNAGGISFAPLGHTVTSNYVANQANSNDRGGLHIDSDPLDASSSTTIIADASLDLTTVVANNTIINNDQAIHFEDASASGTACTLLAYSLDFDDNLFANQSSANNIFGADRGAGDPAVTEADYVANGCGLDVSSTFNNNRLYSATLSDIGDGSAITTITLLPADGNITGAEDGATLTAPDTNLLVEGTGPDAGVGADLDDLIFLEEDMVGPGSTFVVP